MKISAQDKGKYVRALLLLIGKDNLISEDEKKWLIKISNILGYDLAFIKSAIRELPENEYIKKEPPIFSDKKIARSFIIDALHLSFADNNFHPKELEWINLIAEANGVDILHGMNELEKLKKSNFNDINEFEIKKLLKE